MADASGTPKGIGLLCMLLAPAKPFYWKIITHTRYSYTVYQVYCCCEIRVPMPPQPMLCPALGSWQGVHERTWYGKISAGECVRHIKPFFLPVDIRTPCPC